MSFVRVIVLALLFQFPLLFQAVARAEPQQSPVVIIHGAWGGAHHWKTVADSLMREHGRVVRRASLTGLGERQHLASKEIDLDTHIEDVLSILSYDDLTQVILVAHSYGGAVARGVTNAAPERLSQVIYLDAHLLEHGESYLSRHEEKRATLTKRAEEDGDGWLIPVDWDPAIRDTPHPLATLVQPLTLTNRAAHDVPSTFLLFADGKPTEEDSRYFYYQRAAGYGWRVKSLPWDHNPQRSIPAELVEELITHFHDR